MKHMAIAFVVAWVVTLLIIRFNHVHARFSADNDLNGVQKFHARPTPRIGGISLILGLLASTFLSWITMPYMSSYSYWLLFLCTLPAFGGGLIEDLTKKVGVLHRLILTACSAALGYWLLGAGLTSVDLPLVDLFLVLAPVSLLFTCFAVAGVANAINLIDGYNGLSGMVSIMILGALAYVGLQVGDVLIWMPALAMVGAIFGFFVWNYPRGLIFLGDGGAYLIGFMIGELAVLLVARHDNISAWFPLLLVIYPIFETLFTIYRRVVIRKASPGLPDALHMHQMVYMRLVRWAVGSPCADEKTMRNSMTSPYLWLLCSVSVIPAVLFWRYESLLQIFALGFIAVYVLLYRALVRFHAPHFLVRKRPPRSVWRAIEKKDDE